MYPAKKKYLSIEDETSAPLSENTSQATAEKNHTTEETTSLMTEKAETTLSIQDILAPENFPGYNHNYNPNAGTYTINKVGNNWYLKFDSNEREAMFSNEIIGPYSYSSLADLKNALNTLDAADRDDIKLLWEKNEYGVKVINFDNLYTPVLPSGISFIKSKHIAWEEDRYWFYIDWALGNADFFDGTISIITDEDYEKLNNGERFQNVEAITEGSKSTKIKMIKKIENGINRYTYYALIETPDVYCYITLNAVTPLDNTDIFLDFDFVKYEG